MIIDHNIAFFSGTEKTWQTAKGVYPAKLKKTEI